ncbi:hypothetical protein EDM54_07965 [Brevibacillus borstelensis]|uniref:hypothetical protein n=1 Tax=Brevibacillus borstelensis TaxID=45462 RepID=UPI000F080FC2|nr:hypothetical protein [Brevibacillus borstelensis]MED1885648.1 hypothetical protein [Brevibacillus borstelensis]RNB64107.1 hypothetical protein EDM54_07965 [Brevibacillus borstelensis]GED54130.1 hypothetical protein BBO01nite_33710 [Brevibacillus borstelensis]
MKAAKAMFAVCFYLLLLPCVLILVTMPLFSILDMIEVANYEAPRLGYPLIVLGVIGGLLFASVRVGALRTLYRKYPVLLPFLHIAYFMAIGTSAGLEVMNQWADSLLFPKWLAIGGAVVIVLVTRVFLSYWYCKYPISLTVRKQG